MASLANLKRRIKSVNNTLKTTSAMQMISSVKMRRAVAATTKSRTFVAAAEEVLARVAAMRSEVTHPLNVIRKVRAVLYVVVTSDKGLAGSYNADVLRKAAVSLRTEREQGHTIAVITVGKKARDFFSRYAEIPITASFDQLDDALPFGASTPIAQAMMDAYSNQEYDRVVVVYKRFISTLHQEVAADTVLPAAQPAPTTAEPATGAYYTFEPDAEAVLAAVLPYLTRMRVYQALLESRASEHASRMVAMKNATDAGSDLVRDLVFTANAIRQEKITAEIAEIAAGAAALHQ